MTDIQEKVYEIVCEHMGASRDKLAPETSFINDLGADSLDTVELVMEFESAFDITIPDEDAEKIQTVGNAIEYISGKVNGYGRRLRALNPFWVIWPISNAESLSPESVR